MTKTRELKPGATYKITKITNWQECIFSNKETKNLFRQVLKDARKKYCFT